MLEVRGGLDLAQEALGTDDGGELRAEDLDRDGAIVPEVVREIDGGHAARTELPLDAVTVGQGRGEAGYGISQAGPLFPRVKKPMRPSGMVMAYKIRSGPARAFS